MNISLSDAKAQLTDLARRAEAGEEVILTRRGRPAVRLVAIGKTESDPAKRFALLERLHGSASKKKGPSAARSQDWLYDDFGLPA